MKLTQLLKENEERPLSNEVKKHFLEIVSTYNKYQEMMDRKSDIAQVAETLGGITEAARTLAIKEAGDWFDAQTVKRNMSELDKLGKQFDKVALEARALDQRLNGLYEDMGHILSRYYKIGEISEEQMRERLGIRESVEDCGCDSPIQEIRLNRGDMVRIIDKPKYVWDKQFWGKSGYIKGIMGKDILVSFPNGRTIVASEKDLVLNPTDEQAVTVSKRTPTGNIITTLKESDLNEEELKLYEFGQKVETLMEENCPTDASKWSYYKSQAKKKFDVYPSAYANGWAAKQYKAAGGGWKNC